jgi:hypothetical protein
MISCKLTRHGKLPTQELTANSTVATTALMAAGIIFIVLVQRKIIVSGFLTFEFEVAKSLLATGLWLWLVLDSAFGPWQNRNWMDPDTEKPRRLERSVVAFVLLL